jgi:hypothetical protein
MPITLHEATVAVFITNLKNLSKFLEKGRLHASSNESTLIEAKLIADMGGLPYQIQRVSDTAKGLAVRIGGVEPVSLTDNETTFPQLQERIQKTINILESIKEETINANEEKEVVLPSRAGEVKFTGKSYALKFAIPNFFFHVVTAYAILRKEGVDVGKSDYLGRN